MKIALFLVALVSNGILNAENYELKEFCQLENFVANCTKNELILVEEANYGRMQVGRCITQKEVSGVLGQDPQYFGCSKNVVDIMHKKCSFRKECLVGIPNAELDATNPCFPGLKSYLEASYRCINAIDSRENCRIIADQRPKYLVLTNRGSCGDQGKPWIVEASRGENVKLTLLILNKATDEFDKYKCSTKLAILQALDGKVKHNISICSEGLLFRASNSHDANSRIHEEFVSKSSRLELTLDLLVVASHQTVQSFIIGIEASGCSDIIPPEDTWLKRNNDDIVIGCYSSKQTWYLRCENGKWTGVVGNCSAGSDTVNGLKQKTVTDEISEGSVTEEQQVILFVAICALGLVICLTIVCIGAICIKKYTWKSGANSVYSKQPMYYPNGQYSLNRQTLTAALHGSAAYAQPETDAASEANGFKSEENKYFVLETNQTE